jgi:hypothetical protein
VLDYILENLYFHIYTIKVRAFLKGLEKIVAGIEPQILDRPTRQISIQIFKLSSKLMYYVATLLDKKFNEIFCTRFADIPKNLYKIFWILFVKCFNLSCNCTCHLL